MGNPVAEINRWSAAAVHWSANSTSTGLSYGLNQKLRDWITVVNGNPSNTSKQLEMWKDESTNTDGTYQGMVLRIYHNITDYWHFGLYGTNTQWDRMASVLWKDNGTKGGYGTYENTGGNHYVWDFGSVSANGTVDVDLYAAYDTTDGEEFFIWTWSVGSIATEDYALIYKNNYGHWAIAMNDQSSHMSMMYSVGRAEATYHEGYLGDSQNVRAYPMISTEDTWSRWWVPAMFANDASYYGRITKAVWPISEHINTFTTSDRVGEWLQLRDGTGNYIAQHMLCFGPYSPWIRIGGSI